MQRLRAIGSAASGLLRPPPPPAAGALRGDLRRLIEATPGITLAELRTELERPFGLVAEPPAPDKARRRIGLRHQKRSLRAAEQDRPEVAGRRRRWRAWQGFMDPARVRRPRWDQHRHEHGAALRPGACRAHGASPPCRAVTGARPRSWRGLKQSGIIAPLALDGSVLWDARPRSPAWDRRRVLRPCRAVPGTGARARRRRVHPSRQQEARPDRRYRPPHHRQRAASAGSTCPSPSTTPRGSPMPRSCRTSVLPCAAFLARAAACCAEIRMRIKRIMTGTAFNYTQSRAILPDVRALPDPRPTVRAAT
jgi:hypothetical protein